MGATIDIELEGVRRAVLRTVRDIEKAMQRADTQLGGLQGSTERSIFGGSPAGGTVDAHFGATVGLVTQLVSNVGQAATGMTDAALTAARNIQNAEEASAQDLARATTRLRDATLDTGELEYGGPPVADMTPEPGGN